MTGRAGVCAAAWCVGAKDLPHNPRPAGQGHDHDPLLKNPLTCRDLNWLSGTAPHCAWGYGAKTRYRQKDAPCTIARVESDTCDIEFAEAHEVPAAPPGPANDAIALIGGLAAYGVVVFWAHRWLIGVSPLP